jgi:hypothetical protein
MPNEVSTVVSIAPYPFEHLIPGVNPSRYTVGKSVNEEPVFLMIRTARQSLFVGMAAAPESDGYFFIDLPSHKIAEDTVTAHKQASISIALGHAEPGIFWLEGEVGKTVLLAKYKTELEDAKTKQRRWYIRLVEEADNEWASTKSTWSITEIQRYAARQLGLKKEWDIDRVVADIRNCPACNTIISPLSVVCPQCRYIVDEVKYKTMKFAE